jgi:predicted DNA-binding protein
MLLLKKKKMMRPHKVYREMCIRLTQEQHDGLREVSLATGDSMCVIVRRALDGYLGDMKEKLACKLPMEGSMTE